MPGTSESCAETKIRSAKSQGRAVNKLYTASESTPVRQSLHAYLEETLIVCFKYYQGILTVGWFLCVCVWFV